MHAYMHIIYIHSAGIYIFSVAIAIYVAKSLLRVGS